jgi:hypothetical protein
MRANEYAPGQPVRVKNAVKLANILVDEAGQVITVRKPDGSYVTPAPTVVHDGLGLYSGVVPGADNMEPGTYNYRFAGPNGAKEGSYVVTRSRVLQ